MAQASISPGLARIVRDLARPADLRALRLPVLHVVMSLRLHAIFDAAGREPVAELATRLRSVEAALAVLALNDAILRCWPERYAPGRPCRLEMTPDERTVADMLRAAARGDRAGFATVLTGFVRGERHERLYELSCGAIATIEASGSRA